MQMRPRPAPYFSRCRSARPRRFTARNRPARSTNTIRRSTLCCLSTAFVAGFFASLAASFGSARDLRPVVARAAPQPAAPAPVEGREAIGRDARDVRSVSLMSRRMHRSRREDRRWDSDLHAHPRKGQFRRFFRMKVTAYTPINTRMEGGRYTKTMRDGRSAHGVAVDPDLIPLGSRLWIPGYGHAIADDTGGRIQDYDRMEEWGVRGVRVYVLEDPPDTE